MQMQLHTIAEGETLASIAEKYYGDATKVEPLLQANKIPNRHYQLTPGKILVVPEVMTTVKLKWTCKVCGATKTEEFIRGGGEQKTMETLVKSHGQVSPGCNSTHFGLDQL